MLVDIIKIRHVTNTGNNIKEDLVIANSDIVPTKSFSLVLIRAQNKTKVPGRIDSNAIVRNFL